MAEAVHFAGRHGFSVQAATADALNSTRLIADAARAAGIATPLPDLSSDLYDETLRLGNGRLDMVSVIEAIEARSEAVDRPLERTGTA